VVSAGDVPGTTRPVHGALFWLRWSWRDLRGRWVAVAAIAVVLAIGTGVFAGLGSTATWRRQSNDASFAVTAMHDVRVTLSPGTFAAEGRLLDAVTRADTGGVVASASERLTVDGQLDASTEGAPLLAQARIVGGPLGPLGTPGLVDNVWLSAGTLPAAATATAADGVPTAVLEAKFADYHGLAPAGELVVNGDRRVRYTGLGAGPEEFFVAGPEGTIFAEGEIGTLYLDLPAAQTLLGREGEVNDLVLTVSDPAARDELQAGVEQALADAGLSAEVSTRDEAEAYRVLYEDIENDQQFWNALSALVLFAAALAAFNLVNRVVEAQRREIGIGMALGVPARQLAIRPILLGVEIAVLGTVLGVLAGLLVGLAMGDLLKSLLPLPRHLTPFQLGVFARAGILALAIPVAASLLPVWRAVRVQPIEAIRTGHLAVRPSRLADRMASIPLPGGTLFHFPVRNVLRALRRSVLTALGVAAAVTALVAVLALLDSFRRAIDVGGEQMMRAQPDRIVASLDTFYPREGEPLRTIAALDRVAAVEPGIRLPGTLTSEGHEGFTVAVDLVDLAGPRWIPTDEPVAATSGLVIARKAARDLDVDIGSTVTLTHPARDAAGRLSLTRSALTVTALHDSPIRTLVYGDTALARSFGFGDVANIASVYPVAGASRAEVRRDLFVVEGVAATQAVARVTELFDEALQQFQGFLGVAAGAVLLLALLIAFNASRITVDERRRELATMRAFGLPVRTVTGLLVRESVIIGLLATVLGMAAGSVFLRWMLSSLAARTLPDIGIEPTMSAATVGIALLVGVAAVALAPVLLVRRLARMSIPDTLRVME
jgi:putative ABC transport system permease protein